MFSFYHSGFLVGVFFFFKSSSMPCLTSLSYISPGGYEVTTKEKNSKGEHIAWACNPGEETFGLDFPRKHLTPLQYWK